MNRFGNFLKRYAFGGNQQQEDDEEVKQEEQQQEAAQQIQQAENEQRQFNQLVGAQQLPPPSKANDPPPSLDIQDDIDRFLATGQSPRNQFNSPVHMQPPPEQEEISAFAPEEEIKQFEDAQKRRQLDRIAQVGVQNDLNNTLNNVVTEELVPSSSSQVSTVQRPTKKRDLKRQKSSEQDLMGPPKQKQPFDYNTKRASVLENATQQVIKSYESKYKQLLKKSDDELIIHQLEAAQNLDQSLIKGQEQPPRKQPTVQEIVDSDGDTRFAFLNKRIAHTRDTAFDNSIKLKLIVDVGGPGGESTEWLIRKDRDTAKDNLVFGNILPISNIMFQKFFDDDTKLRNEGYRRETISKKNRQIQQVIDTSISEQMDLAFTDKKNNGQVKDRIEYLNKFNEGESRFIAQQILEQMAADYPQDQTLTHFLGNYLANTKYSVPVGLPNKEFLIPLKTLSDNQPNLESLIDVNILTENNKYKHGENIFVDAKHIQKTPELLSLYKQIQLKNPQNVVELEKLIRVAEKRQQVIDDVSQAGVPIPTRMLIQNEKQKLKAQNIQFTDENELNVQSMSNVLGQQKMAYVNKIIQKGIQNVHNFWSNDSNYDKVVDIPHAFDYQVFRRNIPQSDLVGNITSKQRQKLLNANDKLQKTSEWYKYIRANDIDIHFSERDIDNDAPTWVKNLSMGYTNTQLFKRLSNIADDERFQFDPTSAWEQTYGPLAFKVHHLDQLTSEREMQEYMNQIGHNFGDSIDLSKVPKLIRNSLGSQLGDPKKSENGLLAIIGSQQMQSIQQKFKEILKERKYYDPEAKISTKEVQAVLGATVARSLYANMQGSDKRRSFFLKGLDMKQYDPSYHIYNPLQTFSFHQSLMNHNSTLHNMLQEVMADDNVPPSVKENFDMQLALEQARSNIHLLSYAGVPLSQQTQQQFIQDQVRPGQDRDKELLELFTPASSRDRKNLDTFEQKAEKTIEQFYQLPEEARNNNQQLQKHIDKLHEILAHTQQAKGTHSQFIEDTEKSMTRDRIQKMKHGRMNITTQDIIKQLQQSGEDSLTIEHLEKQQQVDRTFNAALLDTSLDQMRVPKKTPKPPKEGDITETDSELSAIDMVGEDDEDDYIVSMEQIQQQTEKVNEFKVQIETSEQNEKKDQQKIQTEQIDTSMPIQQQTEPLSIIPSTPAQEKEFSIQYATTARLVQQNLESRIQIRNQTGINSTAQMRQVKQTTDQYISTEKSAQHQEIQAIPQSTHKEIQSMAKQVQDLGIQSYQFPQNQNIMSTVKEIQDLQDAIARQNYTLDQVYTYVNTYQTANNEVNQLSEKLKNEFKNNMVQIQQQHGDNLEIQQFIQHMDGNHALKPDMIDQTFNSYGPQAFIQQYSNKMSNLWSTLQSKFQNMKKFREQSAQSIDKALKNVNNFNKESLSIYTEKSQVEQQIRQELTATNLFSVEQIEQAIRQDDFSLVNTQLAAHVDSTKKSMKQIQKASENISKLQSNLWDANTDYKKLEQEKQQKRTLLIDTIQKQLPSGQLHNVDLVNLNTDDDQNLLQKIPMAVEESRTTLANLDDVRKKIQRQLDSIVSTADASNVTQNRFKQGMINILQKSADQNTQLELQNNAVVAPILQKIKNNQNLTIVESNKLASELETISFNKQAESTKVSEVEQSTLKNVKKFIESVQNKSKKQETFTREMQTLINTMDNNVAQEIRQDPVLTQFMTDLHQGKQLNVNQMRDFQSNLQQLAANVEQKTKYITTYQNMSDSDFKDITNAVREHQRQLSKYQNRTQDLQSLNQEFVTALQNNPNAKAVVDNATGKPMSEFIRAAKRALDIILDDQKQVNDDYQQLLKNAEKGLNDLQQQQSNLTPVKNKIIDILQNSDYSNKNLAILNANSPYPALESEIQKVFEDYRRVRDEYKQIDNKSQSKLEAKLDTMRDYKAKIFAQHSSMKIVNDNLAMEKLLVQDVDNGRFDQVEQRLNLARGEIESKIVSLDSLFQHIDNNIDNFPSEARSYIQSTRPNFQENLKTDLKLAIQCDHPLTKKMGKLLSHARNSLLSLERQQLENYSNLIQLSAPFTSQMMQIANEDIEERSKQSLRLLNNANDIGLGIVQIKKTITSLLDSDQELYFNSNFSRHSSAVIKAAMARNSTDKLMEEYRSALQKMMQFDQQHGNFDFQQSRDVNRAPFRRMTAELEDIMTNVRKVNEQLQLKQKEMGTHHLQQVFKSTTREFLDQTLNQMKNRGNNALANDIASQINHRDSMQQLQILMKNFVFENFGTFLQKFDQGVSFEDMNVQDELLSEVVRGGMIKAQDKEVFEGNIKNSLFHLFKYAKDDIIHKVAENGYRNIARNLKNVSDDEFTGFSLGQQDVPLDLFGRQNFSEHNRHEYARLQKERLFNIAPDLLPIAEQISNNLQNEIVRNRPQLHKIPAQEAVDNLNQIKGYQSDMPMFFGSRNVLTPLERGGDGLFSAPFTMQSKVSATRQIQTGNLNQLKDYGRAIAQRQKQVEELNQKTDADSVDPRVHHKNDSVQRYYKQVAESLIPVVAHMKNQEYYPIYLQGNRNFNGDQLDHRQKAHFLNDFHKNIIEISSMILSAPQMEIENASLIDKKHFENVENFKQTVNHFYGELRLFSNALNANGLQNSDIAQMIQQAIADDENMNFRGKIVDEFQHVYDKMKAHNKIMIANDNAVLEELQEELDNRLRDQEYYDQINDASSRLRQDFEKDMYNMIHKNGLDQFRGLDAGKAREEQKRTIRQASQQVDPRQFIGKSNNQGTPGFFPQTSASNEQQAQQQSGGVQQQQNQKQEQTEGDGLSKKVTDEIQLKIKKEDLNFLKRIHYDKSMAKLMIEDEQSQQLRDLTNEEKNRLTRILAVVLIIIYTNHIKNLSEADKKKVQDNVMKKYRTHDQQYKLIRAINNMAEKESDSLNQGNDQ